MPTSSESEEIFLPLPFSFVWSLAVSGFARRAMPELRLSAKALSESPASLGLSIIFWTNTVFCSATNGILGSRSASDFTREGGRVRGEGGGAVGLGLGDWGGVWTVGLMILRDGVGPGTRAALVVTALVAGEFGTEDVTVAGLGAGELGAEDVVDTGLVEGEVETEADGDGVEAGEVGTEDEVRDGLRVGEGGSEKVVGGNTVEVGTGEVGTEDEGAGALGAGDVGNDATPPAAFTAGDVGTEAIPAAGGTVAAEGGGAGVGSWGCVGTGWGRAVSLNEGRARAGRGCGGGDSGVGVGAGAAGRAIDGKRNHGRGGAGWFDMSRRVFGF